MRREPAPFGKPVLWKWSKIRAGLDAAGEFITTNYKGARRAISLVHPNMSDSTSHTLNMAVQLVKAGEAVYSHRHTNAAMRFVIEGGAGVYTITDGEKCVMETGDLVIQPSWGYHNHINETERDAIWIDCLDSGLMRMLRTMFQEPHPAEDVRLYNSPVDTAVRNPGLLAPPGRPLKSLVYKWDKTRRAVAEMLPENESAYDGKCLEYRNPVTGGSTFPTFSCWVQMLDGGKETQGAPPHLESALLRRRRQRRQRSRRRKTRVGSRRLFCCAQLELAPTYEFISEHSCGPLLDHRPAAARGDRRVSRAGTVIVGQGNMRQNRSYPRPLGEGRVRAV